MGSPAPLQSCDPRSLGESRTWIGVRAGRTRARLLARSPAFPSNCCAVTFDIYLVHPFFLPSLIVRGWKEAFLLSSPVCAFARGTACAEREAEKRQGFTFSSSGNETSCREASEADTGQKAKGRSLLLNVNWLLELHPCSNTQLVFKERH